MRKQIRLYTQVRVDFSCSSLSPRSTLSLPSSLSIPTPHPTCHHSVLLTSASLLPLSVLQIPATPLLTKNLGIGLRPDVSFALPSVLPHMILATHSLILFPPSPCIRSPVFHFDLSSLSPVVFAFNLFHFRFRSCSNPGPYVAPPTLFPPRSLVFTFRALF
jgi:hypothetical protein